MRHATRLLVSLALILSIVGCNPVSSEERPRVADFPPDAEQLYYAIEAKGTLCGYAHVVIHPTTIDGEERTLLRQKMLLLMSALGAEVNTEIDLLFHIDPRSGSYTYSRTDARQGRSRFAWEARIADGTARVSSTLGGKDRIVELPADVLLANTVDFPHLKRDFVDRGLEEATYQAFEVRDAVVRKRTYTRVGTENVTLARRTYEAIVLDEYHAETGIRLKIWIDATTGRVLQGDMPNDRRFYLAEPRIVRQIEVANVTEDLTAKVGWLIPDFQSISYMKVRAVFQPTGLSLTPEMLNVPGQSFVGTVETNRVDGVFEIRHARYDGTDAPAFPPDFSNDDSLVQYLEPAELIESDDPVLIRQARELTADAVDSWDAATRLSRWVAENIDYAIPGGGTARRVYDLRAGECGGHSVLVAAMCRAVGIPARLVWGCQYIPNFGGAFGQHGWNEVYMGDAVGWLPLDATSFEPDYVDSGHIRIGDYRSAATALNPVEMEILEYRLGDGDLVRPDGNHAPAAVAAEEVDGRFAALVGRYVGPRGRTFDVTVFGDGLQVDIGGEIALPFDDADGDGIWSCKFAPQLYAVFGPENGGAIESMWIHEVVRMRRIGEPENLDPGTPEELRGHPGRYLLAAIDAEFTVAWDGGELTIRDPMSGQVSRLQEDANEPGTWVSRRTGNRITFRRGTDGAVEELTVDAGTELLRD